MMPLRATLLTEKTMNNFILFFQNARCGGDLRIPDWPPSPEEEVMMSSLCLGFPVAGFNLQLRFLFSPTIESHVEHPFAPNAPS
jgi:hypothetical protein